MTQNMPLARMATVIDRSFQLIGVQLTRFPPLRGEVVQIMKDSRQAEFVFKISVAMVFDFPRNGAVNAKQLLGDLSSLTHLERTNKMSASQF
jgi:hypothetical protein